MIIQSYAKATSQERRQYGLHVILGGVLQGILPVTIALIFRIVAPRMLLPGSDFYFLTLVFVPVALVTAIMRERRAREYVDNALSHC